MPGRPICCFWACLSFAGAYPATAQSPANPIIANYMQAYGVSASEAERRISYYEKAAALQARLSSEEPIRFAGMYIEHQPQFRVVVRLVGGAEQLLKRYTDDPVFVAEQAQTPLIALRKKQEAIIRSLAHSTPELSTDIDIRSGRLKVYVRNPAQAESGLSAAAVGTDDTDIVQVMQRDKLAVTVQGGEAIDGPTQSDSSYEIGNSGLW